MIITTLSQLKQQVHWPYERLCASTGLSYASFRRWKRRLDCGQPAVFKPGPRKVVPLRLEDLRTVLYHLKHGHQRSCGVGSVYQQYRDQISRRDLQMLTRTMRRELAHQHRADLRHIIWKIPGLVWSLDDAELARFARGKLHLHQVQDLASRYKFTPWVGERVLGETVAGHLEHLFLRYGPPLVLKRDNGSNLNQHAVDALLARYLVIPLNSPPHYPPYNGGIERAIREMKTPLHQMILASGPIPESQAQSWAEMLASELNHNPRGCLEGQIACRVFQDTKSVRKAYNLRKRKKIFDWINDLTRSLVQASAAHTQRQAEAARRLAVETWLQRNGVIIVTQNKKVLPIFPEKSAHN
jgi:transposase InsO family protein